MAAFDRLRTKHLACDSRLRDGRDLVFWGTGRRTRRRSDLLAQLGHRPTAYVDIDPCKIGRRIDGVPVLPPERLPPSNRPLLLSYVASHGAPELIGRRLQAMGYQRGRDFLTVG